MKFRRMAILLLCALAARAAAFAAEPTQNTVSETAEFEGYLIRMDASAPATVSEGEDSDSETADLEYVAGDVYLTRDEALAQELLESGVALSVEPNYVVSLIDPEDEADSGVSLTCDSDGWAYEAVYADEAASLGLDGTGVRIGVIDSGLDLENADLTGAKIAEGYDFVLETTDMCDGVGHGTKVVQVIAGDENGLGCTGIARGATIVPLRCFDDDGSGKVSCIIEAIYDAVDDYDCDIINMSWGISPSEDTLAALHEAIQYAADAGVILVAASGNVTSKFTQGSDVYPASFDEVVSVGSVDSSLTIASTSIQNAGVTVCAPGKSLSFVDENGDTVTKSGTSFAAPCVSAEAALLLQLAPELTVDEFFSLLAERAYDLGDEGRDDAYGYGFTRLDLLLGEAWISVHTDSGQAIGWMRADSAGGFLLASYNAQGQLLQVASLDAADEGKFLRLTAPLTLCSDAASATLFSVGDAYCPLSASARWTLGD